MTARESNPNFMNGVPELLILKLLRHEEMYGYEIVQAIRDRTDWLICRKLGPIWRQQSKKCWQEDNMVKPFNELRERLLRAGVAPRHVRRYLKELADHLADLTAEEERAGRSGADAESAALARARQDG
jgi:hypothetical protein